MERKVAKRAYWQGWRMAARFCACEPVCETRRELAVNMMVILRHEAKMTETRRGYLDGLLEAFGL